MRRIRLGRTGVEVAAIACGTWGHGGPQQADGLAVGWSGHDDGAAAGALVTAWEAGIDHWDTADVYGDGRAEKIIGRLWDRVPRERIFLATKVGWDRGGYDHVYHPRLVAERIERSLRNLAVERIDLYYLHHCDFGPEDRYLDDALEVIERARDAGKLRFIGLSDWSSEKILRYATRVRPDVVQPYRNVMEDTWDSSGLRAWVEEHDAGVAFFSTLRHGLLLGKHREPVHFPEGDHRNRIGAFTDPAELARLGRCRRQVEERLADHPQPVLQALTGALLTDAPTGCILLGMRRPHHAAAAASLGEPLDPEAAAWVKALYRGAG